MSEERLSEEKLDEIIALLKELTAHAALSAERQKIMMDTQAHSVAMQEELKARADVQFAKASSISDRSEAIQAKAEQIQKRAVVMVRIIFGLLGLYILFTILRVFFNHY